MLPTSRKDNDRKDIKNGKSQSDNARQSKTNNTNTASSTKKKNT